jgi:hypothetical protein
MTHYVYVNNYKHSIAEKFLRLKTKPVPILVRPLQNKLYYQQ